MAPQDAGLSALKDEELVVLSYHAISAGPLTDARGELIEPATEQAKAADEVFQAATEELLRRAAGRPIAIHYPDGRVLCIRP